MNLLLHLSDIAIPLILFLVIGFGCMSGVKVYESFLKGAKNGLKLVRDIFKESGPNSCAGLLTSILMSCTETIFYTMSVYFLAAKVTRTRYTLAGALVATLAGTVASVVLTRIMMGM